MEQPCYKCGQSVEEGVAFCPHCAAPQIRVVVAEPPAALPSPDGAAVSSGTAVLSTSQPVPVMVLPTEWGRTLKPCALAALVASLLMVLGLNPFVAMISVGFLAVVFYRQRELGSPMGAGVGARLGALGGLLWFCLTGVLQGTLVAFSGKGSEVRAEMLKKIEQAAAGTTDPQARALMDYFKTPAGLMVLIVFAIIFALVSALMLGALGGVLGGSLFGRRNKS
jgi:hypothetical protein